MRSTLVRVLWVPLVVALLVLFWATFASAQSRIEYVELKAKPTTNGAVLYQEYCASCHGPTAHGNGPAAALLKVPVPDLTLIAQRDGGFDLWHVRLHILDTRGHNPMPDFESAISGVSSDHRTTLVVYNLGKHLEAIQARQEEPAK